MATAEQGRSDTIELPSLRPYASGVIEIIPSNGNGTIHIAEIEIASSRIPYATEDISPQGLEVRKRLPKAQRSETRATRKAIKDELLQRNGGSWLKRLNEVSRMIRNRKVGCVFDQQSIARAKADIAADVATSRTVQNLELFNHLPILHRIAISRGTLTVGYDYMGNRQETKVVKKP